MKKRHRILSLLLVVFLLFTALAVPAAAAELPFTDVPADAWYRNAVEYAYENGLFKGNTPTEFAPNSPMTRAMFVQVLANKTGNYLKADWAGKSSFSDVGKNKWYAAPIEWASKAGLVSGTGNGKFSPEQNVTREQMAAIMYNYAKNTGNDTSFDADALSAFPDAATVSNYAREAMQWAVTHKVIKGSNGKLIPKSSAKRCEVAQVFVNADSLLVKTDVNVSDTPAPSEAPYEVISTLFSSVSSVCSNIDNVEIRALPEIENSLQKYHQTNDPYYIDHCYQLCRNIRSYHQRVVEGLAKCLGLCGDYANLADYKETFESISQQYKNSGLIVDEIPEKDCLPYIEKCKMFYVNENGSSLIRITMEDIWFELYESVNHG